VKTVTVLSRGDCCDELSNFVVRVGNMPPTTQLWMQQSYQCGGLHSASKGQSVSVHCNNVLGQYIYVTRPTTTAAVLSLCEVEVALGLSHSIVAMLRMAFSGIQSQAISAQPQASLAGLVALGAGAVCGSEGASNCTSQQVSVNLHDSLQDNTAILTAELTLGHHRKVTAMRAGNALNELSMNSVMWESILRPLLGSSVPTTSGWALCDVSHTVKYTPARHKVFAKISSDLELPAPSSDNADDDSSPTPSGAPAESHAGKCSVFITSDFISSQPLLG